MKKLSNVCSTVIEWTMRSTLMLPTQTLIMTPQPSCLEGMANLYTYTWRETLTSHDSCKATIIRTHSLWKSFTIWRCIHTLGSETGSSGPKTRWAGMLFASPGRHSSWGGNWSRSYQIKPTLQLATLVNCPPLTTVKIQISPRNMS